MSERDGKPALLSHGATLALLDKHGYPPRRQVPNLLLAASAVAKAQLELDRNHYEARLTEMNAELALLKISSEPPQQVEEPTDIPETES